MQKTALISVTDKTGVVDFAQGLLELGYKILSTGGTAKVLTEGQVPVTEVSEFTGSEEILDGRVKTLHPKVHGGILFDRQNKKHVEEVTGLGIDPIDLIVVNLYQFEKEAKCKQLTLEEAINFIDIGGPTMLRAAAKNWQSCIPVISPSQYQPLLNELKQGDVSRETRLQHAGEVFAKISGYDSMIAQYFGESSFLGLHQSSSLRYGENPHQKAGLYVDPTSPKTGFAGITILQGKEVSYNNLLDLNAACSIARDLNELTAVAIIKHTNPCGTAASRTLPLADVYKKALAGDPKSAFGGIIAMSRELDPETAELISEMFIECIAAPSFSRGALEILGKKKNLRLIEAKWLTEKPCDQKTVRSITGAYLVQDDDHFATDREDWKIATKNAPSETEWDDIWFANTVCAHVKSNAILFVKDLATITIGAGQMSRVDAATFAINKAQEEKKSLKDAVMASDAFFPFRDTVDLAAKYGISSIVQPGGSKRDEDSIKACDENGIAMVFTSERHFRH